jgi:bifunctional UDP-N-acetylglucosamine pyrophosphorylase/glucosamine-1-phosphate N-acetyltransferase
MPEDDLHVVILAAGLGTRMKSSLIKVLHRAAGRPIIDYVIELANSATPRPPVIVVGHQREAVEAFCGPRGRYVLQEEQLGTGHAVLQAGRMLGPLAAGRLLILSGDVPLTRPETLGLLMATHESEGNTATLVSMILDDPGMYGRVIRHVDGGVAKIVEQRDASAEERAVQEVNAGIYLFDTAELFRILATLSTDNVQGEYYLTDVVARLRDEGKRVGAVIVADSTEALGVNSRADLAAVERELTRRHVEALMENGVTFRNPEAVCIDTTVRIGADSVVYPFVTLEGHTEIGARCILESGVHLKDVTVADGAHLKSGTVAEQSEIGPDAQVGPYAHLRPGTRLGVGVRIGNFVETKKASFGPGSKASHLSYIGDAEVGADVNIGAGTITCNYDGVNKHQTVLEDGVFIGSDSQLVAPVRVGKGAYVGAGSTITKDVPPDALAISRTPQKMVEGWAARRREERKKK